MHSPNLEILPPNLNVNSLTLPEGNPREVVSCLQNTPPGLIPDSIDWFDEEGNLVPTNFVELTFVNISRDDAGTYRCTLTVGSVSRSSSLPVVVLCECCCVVFYCVAFVLTRWP